MRQQMQDSLYQTTDTVITLSDSDCRGNLSDGGCKSNCIIQRMQASLYQTAGAVVALSDSRCSSLSIRQRMQDSFYQESCA